MQQGLKEAALKAFRNHGIKGKEGVQNCKRDYKGLSQSLIKQVDSIRQNTYKKRGEAPPSVKYGILPTPIVKFYYQSTSIEHRVPYQLKKVVDGVRRELEFLKLDGNTSSAAYRLRDRTVMDFLREDVAGEISPDELWDSLRYGWRDTSWL